ncbi:hypothetical protein [Flavobacterium pallidum]|uniref:Uncharacterized protein n=1 Tax=Flavobacterium pallidum TaxID=2172098 RepID=A0A2S1SDH0_9FLAO|nr:hypothetical protein [Flavobacterium pallidum]AWI24412.1 hypothetical protein HYN49_00070 [Flavobacterium pallidum]
MKKTKWQKKLLFFMTAVMLALSACQSEDFIVEARRNDEITSRKVCLQEMYKQTGTEKAVAPFLRRGTGNALAKNLVYNEKYGFYVDTDEILMKQQGDDITFTLMVYRDNPDEKTENLALTKQADGSYAVYLIKYDLSEDDKADLQEGLPVLDINQKTEFYTFNETARSGSNGTTWHAGDIVHLKDGRCARINHVNIYQDGSIFFDVEFVTCGPEEPANLSLGEDGDGGGGNGPAVPVWHGIPVHGGGNNGNGTGPGNTGSNGGGGQGPDAPPVLTGPLAPGANPDPCETANKLKNDPDFKAKMADLKLSTNQWFEKVYTAYDFPNPDNLYDNYNYIDFSGTNEHPEMNYRIFYPDKFKGLMHSHYDGLLSVFSVTDLEDLYTQMKNPDISDNLFSALVTKSGTQYLMIISDPVKFLAFGDRYLSSEHKRNKLIELSQKQYAINENGTNQVNEKGFVKMLSKLAGGLDVFSGNADFTNWTKLTYNEQTDAVIPSDCL